jgi:hypothetical protein
LRIGAFEKLNFLEPGILSIFLSKKYFFASSSGKSVKGSWVARMGQNDDYPVFQPKTSSA